ncbi:UDP-N-acetylmuramoyl-L-alanyl-D-glutamate--2,6-diaminopimelate ligase [Sutcliffiella rhizosphaerae]|uniref:UDP-N-acetylmuramyl-tripeptide synthetase n=1 Tax=Sutcliffiella rhizosphaerae TaxID=2880967 RepID=A0ABM8YL84_9BACI|nr:UDP-N-acetylmuramoyl-L-alanyl-D-glutamate--2,6-diaminopimelate ligase [Sutcliffiella rhizosphaerae]CAG9620566.1 UDP-N-acetylmuramoyl-L-alanyl-D-glutamate--2, 6-diaminopimelate ligase [Sutcliffiella rhizosphaerae]
MKTIALFSNVSVIKVYGEYPLAVSNIFTDSRQVTPDSVFVCIKGYTVDGHHYISSAIEKGASVIVVQDIPDQMYEDVCYVHVRDTERAAGHLANKFFDYPSTKLRIVGVTGTNGKTTVSSVINSVLRREGYKTGLSGTIEIDIDGEKFESKNTTSDVLTMQRMLKDMVEAGVTDVVMEVSSHGLVLGRLAGVDFQNGVFTNLTQDHLDFHGTMEHYKYAKGLLFAHLGQDLRKDKAAIVNADDEVSKDYITMTSARIISYGIKNEADFRAENIRFHESKTSFTLKTNFGEYDLDIPFIGEFNVYNILSVICVLWDKGMPFERILMHLKETPPPSGRMEIFQTGDKRNVIIDYAHTEDAIGKVLDSIRMFSTKKIISIIGTGGGRDKDKRPKMGRIATEKSDYCIFTTDNPLDEPGKEIVDMLAAGAIDDQFECIPDREEAITRAVEIAKEGDVVLIAGKGHENYQLIGKEVVPFDEKEITLRAIRDYPLTENIPTT